MVIISKHNVILSQRLNMRRSPTSITSITKSIKPCLPCLHLHLPLHTAGPTHPNKTHLFSLPFQHQTQAEKPQNLELGFPEEVELNSITDHSYWTQKIHTLCSSPTNTNVDAALHLLDRLRLQGYHPTSITLSAIIHSLCDSHRFDEAHRRLFLLSSNWIPDDRTANSLISRLLDARRTPQLTLQFIDRLIRSNPSFTPSLTNYNRLIDQFSSLCRLSEACRLLVDMKARGCRPNTVSYTALINGFARIGQLDDARKLFAEMVQLGVSANSLTYSVLIKGVFRKRRVEEGRELMLKLWSKMEDDKEEELLVKSAAFANLIDSLCREGFFHEVFRIAEEMPQGKSVKEEFAYGQMIDSLCRAGRHHGASRIVYIMRKRGFVPSLVSYNYIVHGLSRNKGCMRAYQLFKEGIEFGYSLPEPTYKILVESLCREMDLSKAKDVAAFMLGINGINKTRIYNIFLSALRLVDNPSEQLNVLVSMLQKQCRPDVVTLNTVIHGFCKIGKVVEATKILNDMLKGNFCAPDVVTFTTIIGGLLDAGKSEEALDLLYQTMPEYSCSPNVITYNAIFRGLFKLKKADEAMKVFDEMRQKGSCADSTTYAVIIEGLCEVGQLEEAKRFWDDVIWPSKTHDDYVYTAIIRGLCCSEKLDAACDFLYELVDCGVSPGLVNYNILVDHACKLGLKKKAYQIVGEMRKNGLKPDIVSWRVLDKLHERESKMRGDGNQGSEAKQTVEEKPTVMEFEDDIGHIIKEEKKCDSVTDEQFDPLEGLVDPSLSTEVPGEYWTTNKECTGTGRVDFNGDVDKKKPLELRQREPLSQIARRVFGLL